MKPRNLEHLEIHWEKKMGNSNLETVTVSSDNAFYDIKIKDFRSATEPFEIMVFFVHTDESFEYLFRAKIIPNLVENTECWLAFNPIFAIHRDLVNDRNGQYLCSTLSIVDVEGNSRFPRCVQNFQAAMFSSRPTDDTRYLKKSFILEREEEFLPDGVLTLRVDFIFDLRYIDGLDEDDHTNIPKTNFLLSGKWCPRTIKKDTTEPQNDNFTKLSNYDLKVYDYTCKILDLPQFHEARRRFGVYGFTPKSSHRSELEELNSDIFEHVWMFDIKDEFQSFFHRFLLSLDEREDSVGTKLLKASPVLSRMVNAPMIEQRDKLIELEDIRSFLTFFYTLTFLDRGKFETKDLDDLVGVYQFSHLYGMEELQRKCAKSMAENSEHESELEELERIAEHYQDKYLSLVLKSRRDEHGTLKQTLFRTDDVPYSDCYI